MNSEEYVDELLVYIHTWPPAEAVSLCVSELRSPLVTIATASRLIAQYSPEQSSCQQCAQDLYAVARVFGDSLVSNELMDIRQVLVARDPLHPEHSGMIEPWPARLDDTAKNLVERMSSVVAQMKSMLPTLQQSCAGRLSSDIAPLVEMCVAGPDRIQALIDHLITGALVERLRTLE